MKKNFIVRRKRTIVGFSIFLTENLQTETKTYIKKMAEHGFKGVFTSLHIPEENPSLYSSRLRELGKICQEYNLDLMVDISGEALQKAGFSFQQMNQLIELGVTGLRMDYHISNAQIAELSHQIKIGLNASTITMKDIDELITEQANFKSLEAWHNYYPRPNTALDRQWYEEKNKWLKTYGFTIQAFVPGDYQLRGPLYEGLPTLEEHRHVHPLAAMLDLRKSTDLIYVGDGGLSNHVMKQFKHYLINEEILLEVDAYDPQIDYVIGLHVNRQDEARDVLRSADARFRPVKQIKAISPRLREIGAVTIDNEEYKRYQGEIQIIKRQLPEDRKVNVVGRVIRQDRPLIQKITGGQKFRIVSVNKND